MPDKHRKRRPKALVGGPAWLTADAPKGDVVLSSRCRTARNLAGHRFPHLCDTAELEKIARQVISAQSAGGLNLSIYRAMTITERDQFVSARLCSPDFAWKDPGRIFLVNHDQSISILVNEEDHLRIQAVTAGWSIEAAIGMSDQLLHQLQPHLNFSRSERYGYVCSSPYNSGEGRRHSAMFHLIGLAHQKSLKRVLEALSVYGVVCRGLFGESSRATGAFLQVSITRGSIAEFVGACDYISQEERVARASIQREELAEKAADAVAFAERSTTLQLADALRIIAWLRWAALVGALGEGVSVRHVDYALAQLELHTGQSETKAAAVRADWMRGVLEDLGLL